MGKIEILDCTLRDGAYIVNGDFGESAIRGILKKLSDARVDIIECGWLKDAPHEKGSTYYHIPEDAREYIGRKNKRCTYVAMIDYNRYDDAILPVCDEDSIDAIRVVFPHGHHKEGIDIALRIKEKGYKVYLQAANTLAYSDDELRELAGDVNKLEPEALSIVDTFGAMYFDDIERITGIFDEELADNIGLGFHSHNNQQLSYALSIRFSEVMADKNRKAVIDASLCGMGRGAGNTTTELIVNYFNQRLAGNYNLNAVLDAIDTYMEYFKENYSWGYSTPYMIAGIYCSHVNNIAYLLENHRTKAQDIRNILDSMTPAQRTQYDYDLLEERYIENQNLMVDDEDALEELNRILADREVLLVAPGRSSLDDMERIRAHILKNNPVVMGVNAIIPGYNYDYLFIVNAARYDYAKTTYKDIFLKTKRILLSNIKSKPDEDEYIITFSKAIKRGYPHFDNSVITCLRFLNLIGAKNVSVAGFDGFKTSYNESYADVQLPTLNPNGRWDELNEEIKKMTEELIKSVEGKMEIEFITKSIFGKVQKR